MTELQWLIHMLTKQKLPNALKDLFIERIGEVEANLVPKAHGTRPASQMQRPMDQPVQDINTIAQTQAAAAALESRQLAIKIANSGKPEPGRTSPRKF